MSRFQQTKGLGLRSNVRGMSHNEDKAAEDNHERKKGVRPKARHVERLFVSKVDDKCIRRDSCTRHAASDNNIYYWQDCRTKDKFSHIVRSGFDLVTNTSLSDHYLDDSNYVQTYLFGVW